MLSDLVPPASPMDLTFRLALGNPCFVEDVAALKKEDGRNKWCQMCLGGTMDISETWENHMRDRLRWVHLWCPDGVAALVALETLRETYIHKLHLLHGYGSKPYTPAEYQSSWQMDFLSTKKRHSRFRPIPTL